MKAERKVSLEQLYNQRKQNTPMPAALKQSLLNAVERQKKNRHKKIAAVMTTACTALLIVLILPRQLQPVTDFASLSNSEELKTQAIQATPPAPAMRSSQEKMSILSADAEVASEHAPLSSIASGEQNTLILKAVPNQSGLFENCEGEQVPYDIKTDIEGWFEAIRSPAQGWLIETSKGCQQVE